MIINPQGVCVGSALSFGGMSYLLAQAAETIQAPNWTNLGIAGALATILGFFMRHMITVVIPQMLLSNQTAFESIARTHKEAVTDLIEDRKYDRTIAREDLAADRAMRERLQGEAMREYRDRNDALQRKLDELSSKIDYNHRLLLLLRERGCKNMTGPGSLNATDDSGILGPSVLTRQRKPDTPKGDKSEGGKK